MSCYKLRYGFKHFSTHTDLTSSFSNICPSTQPLTLTKIQRFHKLIICNIQYMSICNTYIYRSIYKQYISYSFKNHNLHQPLMANTNGRIQYKALSNNSTMPRGRSLCVTENGACLKYVNELSQIAEFSRYWWFAEIHKGIHILIRRR